MRDAMEVTLEKHDVAAFRKLDYWQQWDAMCGHAAHDYEFWSRPFDLAFAARARKKASQLV